MGVSETWEVTILRIMQELGSSADLSHVYRALEEGPSLTANDLRETKWGGRPAYQHQVRSHVSNLCKAKQLRNVARGRYEITPEGRARLDGLTDLEEA